MNRNNEVAETRTCPALLVIDLQRGFFSKPVRNDTLPEKLVKVNELIDLFHSLDLPVVHVLTVHQPDGSTVDLRAREQQEVSLVEGTPDADELPEVHASEKDVFVTKTRHSAFVRTDLDDRLWGLDVNTVVLSGFSTHACIGLSAIDAFERDIMPVLAAEAMLGIGREREAGMLEVLKNEYAIEPVSNQRITELVRGWVSG